MLLPFSLFISLTLSTLFFFAILLYFFFHLFSSLLCLSFSVSFIFPFFPFLFSLFSFLVTYFFHFCVTGPPPASKEEYLQEIISQIQSIYLTHPKVMDMIMWLIKQQITSLRQLDKRMFTFRKQLF